MATTFEPAHAGDTDAPVHHAHDSSGLCKLDASREVVFLTPLGAGFPMVRMVLVVRRAAPEDDDDETKA
jgi:hypothetical protein